MAEVFAVNARWPEESSHAIEAAVAALAAGQLVVLPTETVYALACRADLPAATARVFAAKRRPTELALPLLAPTARVAFELAEPNASALALALAFWPGPLTLVLPRTDRSRPWALGEAADTIGVRVPDHGITQALLARAGAFAATSANVSGSPPLVDPDELVAAFGPSAAVILVLDGEADDPNLGGRPSTVVDLTGGRAVILRHGAIAPRELAAAAGPSAEGQWVDFNP
jgi:tRNA threonylcarbamoyl adenosine modification protein (Sua5/YciO/YrdC/YwlC family)